MFRNFLLLALAGLGVSAQVPSRDAYRGAYRNWREVDPSLEHDASTAKTAFTERAAQVTAEEAKFAAARENFLDGLTAEAGGILSWLEDARAVEPSITEPKSPDEYLGTADFAVRRGLETLSKDADRGILPLRRALDRESKVLADLKSAVDDEQKSARDLRDASDAVEKAILQATVEQRVLMAGMRQTFDDTKHGAEAWAEYYLALGKVVSAPPEPALPPASAVRTELPPSITPVPLIRYTGSWVYPAVSGEFHGLEPELAELSVSEENSHATGTMVARFKLPPGNTGDRELRFGFSGDFQNTLKQTFNLITTEGIKGTLELTPGGAFNLLQVDIRTEGKAGKIHQASFTLLKK